MQHTHRDFNTHSTSSCKLGGARRRQIPPQDNMLFLQTPRRDRRDYLTNENVRVTFKYRNISSSSAASIRMKLSETTTIFHAENSDTIRGTPYSMTTYCYCVLYGG